MSVFAVVLAVIPAAGCSQPNTAGAVPSAPSRPTWSGFAPPPGPTAPPTTDPKTIIQRSVEAHHAAKLLRVTMETDGYSGPNRNLAAHQRTDLVYQTEPPRLWMKTQHQDAGTATYYFDGSSLVSYRGLNNTFSRKAVGGGLAEACEAIDSRAPQLVNPLSFLMEGGVIERLYNLSLVGRDKVEGRSAYVIYGDYTPAYLGSKTKGLGLYGSTKPIRGNVKLWIDEQSYLLLQAQVSLDWKSTKSAANGPAAVAPTMLIRTTKSLTTQPPANQDEFRFVPPRNAKELFSQRLGQ